MDIKLVVNITSRAWALPILAALHRGTPGRQAALMTATGAGRTAFGLSLAHLKDLGLVVHNPGHGHPLRPEYTLSDLGRPVAEMADRILGAGPDAPITPLLRRAWTVPILAVTTAPSSFTTIKTKLPQVTDRALSQSLKQLQAARWVHRNIDGSVHPPRATYHAQGRGKQIADAVGLEH